MPEATSSTTSNDGRGIGYIDAHPVAAAALADPARLWTRDKRLVKVAADLTLAHEQKVIGVCPRILNTRQRRLNFLSFFLSLGRAFDGRAANIGASHVLASPQSDGERGPRPRCGDIVGSVGDFAVTPVVLVLRVERTSRSRHSGACAAQDSSVGCRFGASGVPPRSGWKGFAPKVPAPPQTPGCVVLSGRDGDDAHPYQERHVRNAIREVTK
jgi:hypothetical protein